MKLFEISERYKNLFELLENPEIEPEMVQSALNEVQGEFNDKAQNIVYIIKNMLSDKEKLDNMQQQLGIKSESLDGKIKHLKDYLKAEMLVTNQQKIKTDIFTISLRKSTAVNILDESAIIDRFIDCKVIRTLSKSAIKEALKAGETVVGAELKENQNLNIK